MIPDEAGLRRAVIDTARTMSASGLSPVCSGNVSARFGNGMLITPSGMAYDAISPEDVVRIGLDGATPPDQRAPSSEWPMHAAIYGARPAAGAVVHAHSPNATALACLRRPIPAFHYMVAVAGGRVIDCADYATFGSGELARNALAALGDRRACLLANHGQLAFGAALADALALAQEVEALATQYCAALRLGTPTLLDDAEMDRVLRKFESYGVQPDPD